LGLNYEKRSELRRVDPDAMQTLIAAFEAASWDEAKAVFDEHYSE
jgi:Spy/CpxP family protein refolding chaperone